MMDINMQRILTIEAASKGRYFVHEVKDEPFFHANMYLHLLEVRQTLHKSSIHRQKRAAELPMFTEEEMLTLLGDIKDQSFPVYMHGKCARITFNIWISGLRSYKTQAS
jgi:hypothetical protein